METEIRREQIAEAALDIVSKDGVGGLTVRKVAKRIGLSAPALYRHYASKADIILAAVDEHCASQVSLLRRAKRANAPLDVLREFYLSNAELIKNHKSAIQIFISDFFRFGEKRLLDAIDRHRTLMLDELGIVFKAGQERGEIRRDIGVEELFVHYLGLIITPDLLYSHREDYVNMDLQTGAGWLLFEAAVSI